MKLPSFNDLAPEQLKVYEYSPYKSMLVVGPPGSGKTSMAVWRARVMVSPELNLSVTLITRNRLLAAVAGQLAREDEHSAINTSTMHRFVWNDYRSRFSKYAPMLGEYIFNWEQIFADYAAAGILPELDHLIIDEGQNLPLQFFFWAKSYGAKHISVFADENQTTDAHGISIRELAAVGFTHVFPLLTNYRNTQNIANLVGHFHAHRVIPKASPMRGAGTTPLLIDVGTWTEFADNVATRFRNRREAIGVIVYQVNEVDHMAELLRHRLPDTRVDSYTNRTPKGGEFDIQMREDGITIISGESAIGLEFDALYLQDLDRSLPVFTPLQQRRLYMLCARARDMLFLVNGPNALTMPQLQSLPSPPTLER